MKHFVIEITYALPVEEIGEVQINEHRQFLQTGYDRGLLLMSGPQVPPLGGFVIGRAGSQAEIEAFFQEDPYLQRGLAAHRFVEFRPVKRQPLLEDWVAGS